MADPNFINIQGRVAREAKMESIETNIVLLLKEWINRAIYDLARERPWPELLTFQNISLTGGTVPGTAKGSLANDFLKENRVRFYDASGPSTWPLSERSQLVQPAPVYGLPAAYQITNRGATDPLLQIQIEPVLGVDLTNDKVLFEYYKTPAPLTADADILVSYVWYEEVVKRAVAYAHIWHNKLGQANALLSQSIEGKPAAKE